MIAAELIAEARVQIDAGDLEAAREYMDAADANLAVSMHEDRLNEVLAAATHAEAEADQLWKWRALISYGISNHGGTRDQLRLLELLQTAPKHDKTAPLASKARTNFYNWINTHRGEIARLQKNIINQLPA